MADNMASDNDMPPPLEDMSKLLMQVDKLREVRQAKQQSPKSNCINNSPPKIENGSKKLSETVQSKSIKETKQTSQGTSQSVSKSKSPDGFAGMKKGFLSSGPPTKPHTKQVKDDIPFIKPKVSHEEANQLPEVQNSMKAAQAFQENQDWMTEGLLQKFIKKGRLAKRLNEPSFLSALSEFQTNPSVAMEKYANNTEMTKFLKEFCGVMGEHFEGLAEQQAASGQTPQSATPKIQMPVSEEADLSVRSSTNPKQATAADEQHMQQILSNPEIRDILLDPKVQNIFEMLRNDPEKAHRFLRESDQSTQISLRKLVDAGILQFEL